MRGTSTTMATSTTTTLGMRTDRSRLKKILLNRRLSKCSPQETLQQGVLTLSEMTNNSALHTQDSLLEIPEANEEQLFNALFDTMLKKTKGVYWKPSVKAYCLNGVRNIAKLVNEISLDKFHSTTPHPVEIYYPKRRTVLATTFKERVYQGLINDLIYPYMTKSFIYANTASQKGKGTDKARELVKKYLWNFYCNHSLNGYVLQIDIHSYYQSIPLDKALSLFEEKLPYHLYLRVKEVLDTQYPYTFYAGSQMVQILGISYLDKLDHYIKERLHIKYYIRYQDDLFLIHHDKDYLSFCLERIKLEIEELGLSLNLKKTHIKPISKPFYFLGFFYTLNSNGSIYMKANPKSVKHERYILKKCSKKKSYNELREQLESYLSHIRKGNSQHLETRLIIYARSLYANIDTQRSTARN